MADTAKEKVGFWTSVKALPAQSCPRQSLSATAPAGPRPLRSPPVGGQRTRIRRPSQRRATAVPAAWRGRLAAQRPLRVTVGCRLTCPAAAVRPVPPRPRLLLGFGKRSRHAVQLCICLLLGFFFFFRLPRERFIHTIKVNRKVQQDRVSSAFPSSSTRSEGLRRAQRRRAARRHCPAEQHGAHGTRRCRQTVPSPHPVPVPAALLLPAQSFQAAPTQEAAPPPGTARAKNTPPPPLRGLSGQREQK